jgi:hypothetical protein
MLEHCCGDLLPFSNQSIREVGHWCWAIRPGSQSAFHFIPKDSMELRSELWAGQSSSSTLISTNHFCMDLALCKGHCHAETGKDLPQNSYYKVGSTESSRMELHVVALRFPFTRSNGDCLWRMHGCVLDFIDLSATGVAEIAESTKRKGCPHTFV